MGLEGGHQAGQIAFDELLSDDVGVIQPGLGKGAGRVVDLDREGWAGCLALVIHGEPGQSESGRGRRSCRHGGRRDRRPFDRSDPGPP